MQIEEKALLAEANPFLSVVIPLFNEEQRLLTGFKTIYGYLSSKTYTWEIIFVDDGSVDATYKILLEVLEHDTQKRVRVLKNARNRGKGYAVRNGILSAQGEIILFADIDLSVPVTYIDAFIAKIASGLCDAAIGSRKIKDSKVEIRQSHVRKFMGKWFTFISNLLLGTSFSDHTCGMKAFKRDIAHRLFCSQHIERWAFDSEILFLSNKMCLRVAEVPVLWRDMPGTKVHMFRDAIRSFADILRIRFYHRGNIG